MMFMMLKVTWSSLDQNILPMNTAVTPRMFCPTGVRPKSTEYVYDNVTEDVSFVAGRSPVTEYALSINEHTEPTIDHNLTGQQPYQAPTTEYHYGSESGIQTCAKSTKHEYDNVTEEISFDAAKSPVTEYAWSINEPPEPHIDHKLTGQQPHQAPTTEYYCGSECGSDLPDIEGKSSTTQYNMSEMVTHF